MADNIKEENIDDNEGMVARPEDIKEDDTLSFKPEEPAVPGRGFSKKDKRLVWIVGVIVILPFLVLSLIFGKLDVFSIFFNR